MINACIKQLPSKIQSNQFLLEKQKVLVKTEINKKNLD